MKAAAFSYERPATVAEAIEMLRSCDGYAKVLAGGQSLGPMLNLRLVEVELLVDVSRIPELKRAEEDGGAVVIGGGVTHAAVEDGEVPDPAAGGLAAVARGVAYRAVRNRGTVGGSLAHADPAADWLTTLTALDAEVVVTGAGGERVSRLSEFVVGVYETNLAPDEILTAIRVPKLTGSGRFGYYKFCRKTGEFAETMAAVTWDPERDVHRAVIGATDSTPLVIEDLREVLDGDGGDGPGRLDPTAVLARLEDRGLAADPYLRQIHQVALKRALARAGDP